MRQEVTLICTRRSFLCIQEIQKLVAFLGAYLCQILKEMNTISVVSFAFLVHVLIQKLQECPLRKAQQKIMIFPLYTKSHFWFIS